MESPPQRSGRSDLSDPELLLCDFLWEHTVMTRCLADDVYPLHMNVGYSHGLPGTQLHTVLNRMMDRGIVTASSGLANADSSVTLTAFGGARWELERNPRWDCFISERGNIADNRLTVVAPNERLGRHYIGARIAADIEVQTGPIAVRRYINLNLLPWRHFKDLTVLRFARYPTGSRHPQWDVYYERRSWWTTLAELSTLNGKLG